MSGICDTCKRDPCHMRFDGCKTCDVYEGGESNYTRLFGTPERAVRTLEEFELDQLNWCCGMDMCEKCPYEFDRYGCAFPEGFSLLGWLRGEA